MDEVVITGQHTHICVRHSSYGALTHGYKITIPRDAVCGFEGVDEDEALAYLRHGVRSDDQLGGRARGHAGRCDDLTELAR